MNYKLFILLISTLYSEVHLHNFTCDYKSKDFRCRLTATPYRYIANYNETEIKFPGCEAKKIWLLIRHGTRYPKEKVFDDMAKLEEFRDEILKNCKNNCNLTEKHMTNLKNWKFSYGHINHLAMAEEGGIELRELAERFQARFPKLMPIKYDNRTYKFKYTNKLRTKESAGNFTVGLFGKEENLNITYLPAEEKDHIQQFYNACDKWQRDVKDYRKSHSEVEKLNTSPQMIEILRNISDRLGVAVDVDKLESIRTTCAFETTWNENSKSPWCELLSPDEFQIMEFSYDLKFYWIDGYGYPLAYQHACPDLRDMFQFLDSDDEFKVSAYFAHTGTLLGVLSLLGIARDPEPLRHDSYNSSKDRLWRLGLINAFTANFGFISYDCQSTESGSEKRDKIRSILVMYQERILNLPGCPENYPCPLEIMKEKYPDKEDECQIEELCKL